MAKKTVRTTKVITVRTFLSNYLGTDDFRYNYLSHRDLNSLNIKGINTLPSNITDIYPNIFIAGLAFRVIDCNNNIEIYKKPFAKLDEEIFLNDYFEDEEDNILIEAKYGKLEPQMKLGGMKW